ncbi:transposase [Paenarthrobacter sp. Z7-10]|uniref:transposase n=1 Tax=Paenarthrobacter sp. Z7-10 TaxID=2787635 RepID=UPI003FA79B2A|nr:transposase [Paenarthrobacter sp. Z7-10]
MLCRDGPLSAATVLVAAGGNPERLASKASFTSLSGAASIPASSGQPVCHRLSHGGNRHPNNVLHRRCCCACATANPARWRISNSAAPNDSPTETSSAA